MVESRDVTRRLLFDVTGLLHWYAFFPNPSGIQRVTEKLLSSTAVQQDRRVEFVARALGGDELYKVDSGTLRDLQDPLRRRAAIARLRALFTMTMRQARPRGPLSDVAIVHVPYFLLGLTRLAPLVEAWFGRRLPTALPPLEVVTEPGPQDMFFNPGDLWWQNQYAPFVLGLKTRTGVKVVQMIHDLFFIERPDWFSPTFARTFPSAFGGVAPGVDRWLTNSTFVKEQLRTYMESHSLPPRPVEVLPMGWDSFAASRGEDRPGAAAVLRRYGIVGQPFILFVGTVEPRKNLATLLDVMEELRRDLGERVPELVVVGGYGWSAKGLAARLWRNRHTRWLTRVRDADLSALYRAALFTVSPSYSEGWGLPVQESIAHGVPCIASSGGALRESGRGLAVHFDPLDPASLKSAMAHLITDDAALQRERERIAEALGSEHFPTWNDAGQMLLKQASLDGNGRDL
jgi:glycosyltransferase involved in cell wall biosynthesis